MQQHHKFGVSIKAVVMNNNGKILIIKSDEGIWDLPGGHMEPNESLQDCVSREVNEELGVDCKIVDEKPLFVWSGVSDRGEPKVSIGFKSELSSLVFKSSDENTESRFFGKGDLDAIKLQNTIRNLKSWLKN